ncbi:uncharacterized protein LOC132706942 [Cylas formicarius]|uniref:uncharacterized protein LOC132706942 n=1 Tax=Cylas formicarius TaxID=197179 RepID=UPI002958B5C1|nr:uncharacterized protein LOC132706942 [Cylas formicarius]
MKLSPTSVGHRDASAAICGVLRHDAKSQPPVLRSPTQVCCFKSCFWLIFRDFFVVLASFSNLKFCETSGFFSGLLFESFCADYFGRQIFSGALDLLRLTVDIKTLLYGYPFCGPRSLSRLASGFSQDTGSGSGFSACSMRSGW